MNQTGTASPTVEVSQVRVYSAPGRVKNVLLPVDADPVPMGLHGGVAAHYRAPDDIEPHATTLDYLIASATACDDSSAGMIPSVRANVCAASSAFLSLHDVYSARF